MSDKPTTDEWTVERLYNLYRAHSEEGDAFQAIARAINAALAAAREEWKRDKLPSLERALAAERHTRQTCEVLVKGLQSELDTERKKYEELGEIGNAMVRGLTNKLQEARNLLFAVQPFCEAWQCQSLADEIKDFLDGRTKEPPPLHYKD